MERLLPGALLALPEPIVDCRRSAVLSAPLLICRLLMPPLLLLLGAGSAPMRGMGGGGGARAGATPPALIPKPLVEL
jgi:hypothetical protein